MKNTKENIVKSISTWEDTYRESKNGVTYKYAYKFAGTSVFDASPVFAEYVTVFSIARGVIRSDDYTGRHYTRNGVEYPKTAHIR